MLKPVEQLNALTAASAAAPSLLAVQRQFAQQLWNPQASITKSDNVSVETVVNFGAGMGVYQNNTRLTLLSVVQTTYPVITAVLGDTFFTGLARSYVITTPSTSGNLHGYANKFSAWLTQWLGALADREEAAELAYLPDLAELEWCMYEANFAADSAPFDFSALHAVNPAQQGALCFKLHPSCAVLHSNFPVAQIWRAHQTADVGTPKTSNNSGADMAVDWDAVPERLLLWRERLSQYEITVKLLNCDAASHQFLIGLSVGLGFEQAASNALVVDAALDLQALLLDKVHAGVIVGFVLPAEVLPS